MSGIIEQRHQQASGDDVVGTVHEDVRRYYESTKSDYRHIWHTDKTKSMHYGFHTRPNISHDDAIIEMIRQLANFASITGDDLVLDAGCGMGGSTNWLSENIGCGVIGVDISPTQIEVAKANAIVGTRFYNMDFCETSFPSEWFTVVWALESVCHAPDKQKFVREAYRLLRPGGRLVVADGFGTQPNSSKVLEGWAVSDLAGIEQFMEYMKVAGFRNTSFRDITGSVMPSSRRMYIAALVLYPVHLLCRVMCMRGSVQSRNVETAIEQYRLLSSGVFRYCMFVGEKP